MNKPLTLEQISQNLQSRRETIEKTTKQEVEKQIQDQVTKEFKTLNQSMRNYLELELTNFLNAIQYDLTIDQQQKYDQIIESQQATIDQLQELVTANQATIQQLKDTQLHLMSSLTEYEILATQTLEKAQNQAQQQIESHIESSELKGRGQTTLLYVLFAMIALLLIMTMVIMWKLR